MTAVPTRNALRATSLAVLLILAALAFFAPGAAAAGWLVGFTTVAAVVLGALALLLIHALTGGRWGDEGRPALAAAAAATPLLLPAFLLLVAAAPFVYPWVTQPGSAGPGVAARYLNLAFFAVRGLVLLGGLSLFAGLDARGALGRLAAGIGLVWYAVGLDLVAVDWLQSVEPRFTSSAFGAQIIVGEFVAAFAWTILVTPPTDDEGLWNDLGSLLLATVLGESYLVLMTMVVHWYGDQPHQAEWWLRRSAHGWQGLEVAGVLGGSVAPLAALLFSAVRRRARPLKLVAGAALAGVLVEMVWLVAPATGGWAVLTGPLAALGLAALLIGFGRQTDAPAAPAREVADGV